jgi:hypothetical protein
MCFIDNFFNRNHLYNSFWDHLRYVFLNILNRIVVCFGNFPWYLLKRPFLLILDNFLLNWNFLSPFTSFVVYHSVLEGNVFNATLAFIGNLCYL